MSISSKQLRAIDKEIVLGMAEALMILNGKTSTLDVKKELRKQGYFATQSVVSHFMDILGDEENWVFEFNGTFRIYAFEEDTEDTFQGYLEKDGRFWEMVVHGQDQIIFHGRLGTLGELSRITMDSNRHAILNARHLFDKKLEDGFEEKEDVRNLSLDLRLKYFAYLKKAVKEVTLSYFGIHKTEYCPVKVQKDGSVQEARMKVMKNAGYELYFEHAYGVNGLLRSATWEAMNAGFDDYFLLGEKQVESKIYNENGVWDKQYLKSYEADFKTKSLLVDNNCLYRVDFVFEDGEVMSLSKFELDLKSELLPLAQIILAD